MYTVAVKTQAGEQAYSIRILNDHYIAFDIFSQCSLLHGKVPKKGNFSHISVPPEKTPDFGRPKN